MANLFRKIASLAAMLLPNPRNDGVCNTCGAAAMKNDDVCWECYGEQQW